MSNDSGSTGSVIAAFVIGAVAGAAIALLLAPASGEETRRKLAEKAREGAGKIKEAARDGQDFLRRQRETVADAVERGREAFEQARKETQ